MKLTSFASLSKARELHWTVQEVENVSGTSKIVLYANGDIAQRKKFLLNLATSKKYAMQANYRPYK